MDEVNDNFRHAGVQFIFVAIPGNCTCEGQFFQCSLCNARVGLCSAADLDQRIGLKLDGILWLLIKHSVVTCCTEKKTERGQHISHLMERYMCLGKSASSWHKCSRTCTHTHTSQNNSSEPTRFTEEGVYTEVWSYRNITSPASSCVTQCLCVCKKKNWSEQQSYHSISMHHLGNYKQKKKNSL